MKLSDEAYYLYAFRAGDAKMVGYRTEVRLALNRGVIKRPPAPPCCAQTPAVAADNVTQASDKYTKPFTQCFEVDGAIANTKQNSYAPRPQEQPRIRRQGSTPVETNEGLRLNLAGCSATLPVLRESARRRIGPRAVKVLRLWP